MNQAYVHVYRPMCDISGKLCSVIYYIGRASMTEAWIGMQAYSIEVNKKYEGGKTAHVSWGQSYLDYLGHVTIYLLIHTMTCRPTHPHSTLRRSNTVDKQVPPHNAMPVRHDATGCDKKTYSDENNAISQKCCDIELQACEMFQSSCQYFSAGQLLSDQGISSIQTCHQGRVPGGVVTCCFWQKSERRMSGKPEVELIFTSSPISNTVTNTRMGRTEVKNMKPPMGYRFAT